MPKEGIFIDTQTSIRHMLELVERPAFCVDDGVIVYANSTAAAHLVPLGSPVAPLISVGAEEYAAFTHGCLYLRLTIEGTAYVTSVTNIDDHHIFTMSSDSACQLQALALAAKELREPLNRIMSISDHLPRSITDDAQSAELMARMNRGLYQLLRMVNNMSDAGAQTAPRMELRDVTAVMQELFDQAAEYCACVGVTLEFHNHPSTVYSLIDTQRIERAIYNMLSNSLKYTEHGGRITARLTRRQNTMYLTISDSGSGMRLNESVAPFDRFRREPGIEDIRHGLGLGLTLVRNTAAVHGGTVLLDPTSESGTKITLSLPIRQNTSTVHSPFMHIDYAGEWNHALVELSDSLPYTLYTPNNR